jgi:hypothetical protein
MIRGDNQPEALTATGEPLRGETAQQRVERERAQAWTHYGNGGGGVIAYFDGYAWERMAGRRLEDEREAARERSR